MTTLVKRTHQNVKLYAHFCLAIIYILFSPQPFRYSTDICLFGKKTRLKIFSSLQQFFFTTNYFALINQFHLLDGDRAQSLVLCYHQILIPTAEVMDR